MEAIVEVTRKYVKNNIRAICHKFACSDIYPPVDHPDSFFMAGSPGAGKTETSKYFIGSILGKTPSRKIVRIDPDEIRESLPNYDPGQAHLFQSATSLAVDKVLDFVFHNNQNFLLDGTFAHNSSYRNITRCLSKGRRVGILYVYQDPKIAWDFTKKRAAIEGRTIPLDAFVDAFFKAKDQVNKVKKDFGTDVQLLLIIKNYHQGTFKTHFNIASLDPYIKMTYNPKTLKNILL